MITHCKICRKVLGHNNKSGYCVLDRDRDPKRKALKARTVTEVFERRDSYTSHSGLSYSQLKAIEDSCYDEIPEFLTYKGKRISLYDKSYRAWEFQLEAAADQVAWKLNKETGWYTHLKTGLKVRVQDSASPDYFKPNGCGTRVVKLIVRRSKERLSNTKSTTREK